MVVSRDSDIHDRLELRESRWGCGTGMTDQQVSGFNGTTDGPDICCGFRSISLVQYGRRHRHRHRH